MKRARIIAVLSLFVVVTGVIMAGVFAASSIKDVQVGGTISISSNVAGVVVEGFYGDKSVGTEDTAPFITPRDSVWEIPVAQLTFDLSEINTVADFEEITPVVLTLRITNNSDLDLVAYFTKSVNDEDVRFSNDAFKDGDDDVITVAVLGKSAGGSSYENYVDLDSIADEGTGNVQVIKLRFTLAEIVEEDFEFNFSYKIVIKEAAAVA